MKTVYIDINNGLNLKMNFCLKALSQLNITVFWDTVRLIFVNNNFRYISY